MVPLCLKKNKTRFYKSFTLSLSNMKKISLIILTFWIFFLTGCSSNNRTWFYYPDADNVWDESTWKIQPWFNSIDECRGWIDSIKWNNENYDYECGYWCRYKSEYWMNVCKKTER
jgi:hypothetical protein